MPKIKTSRTKPPPEGYEDIAPILEDYARKMRDEENEPHEGKRKVESTWGIVSAVSLVCIISASWRKARAAVVVVGTKLEGGERKEGDDRADLPLLPFLLTSLDYRCESRIPVRDTSTTCTT